MKNIQTPFILFVLVLLTITACNKEKETKISPPESYTGTASLSQGLATVSTENLLECSNGREAPIGTSTAIDGSSYYALHWDVPTDWPEEAYDDSTWPSATTFTKSEIGVDNKATYTNFKSVFDDSANDAKFFWSTNVVLDNEVIVRFTVE